MMRPFRIGPVQPGQPMQHMHDNQRDSPRSARRINQLPTMANLRVIGG